MAWYDRDRRPAERAVPARFADVGTQERRLPSWLAKEMPEPDPVIERATSNRPPQARAPSARSVSARPVSARPEPRDSASGHPRPEGERVHANNDRSPSVRANSYRPSRPGTSRSSMSPSELEAIISERATQRVHAELLEGGKLAISEAIEALDQARRDMLYGAEQRLIELAALIARRVIARELKTQPELVADLVREGIDALASREKVRVQLGTGFSMMSVMVAEQLASNGIVAELSIDPSLPEHGCVVETDIGRVDESIESRIEAVLEAIDAEEGG